MGFVREHKGEVTGGLLGGVQGGIIGGILPTMGQLSGADAAREAANQQTAFGREALAALRSDLAPYRQAGADILPQLLQSLQPQNQANFLQNNPLLSSLADDVQGRLFANRAAAGKLGSGGTLTALQNALIPLGLQENQRQFSNMFNIANLGQNAAAQTGAGSANLLTGIGNAQAAGTAAATGLNNKLFGNLLGSAGSILGGIFGG